MIRSKPRTVAPDMPEQRHPVPDARASSSSTDHRAHSPALRITVERPEVGLPVVRMTGEIDLSCTGRLEELIRQRMTAASLRAIVLDLTGITFCGSCGVEMLLQAQCRANQRDVELHVVPGTGPVQRMLELTGTRPFFELHTTTARALAAARGQPR